MRTFPCLCCGYHIFREPPGSYAFCPVCQWQDDISQLRFPRSRGANRVSLIEAQQNYMTFGVSDRQNIDRAPSPRQNEVRDPDWRPLNPDSDQIEKAIPGNDYGLTYPSDQTLLYYWRHG